MCKRGKYVIIGILIAVCAGFTILSWLFFNKLNKSQEETVIYIDNNDTPDSVWNKATLGWRGHLINLVLPYKKVRTGRYVISPNIDILTLYRKLRNGQQDPILLTIPTSRTMEKLAGALSKKIMLDSLTLITAFKDENFCCQKGYCVATLPALFIPNTYEIYWDTSLESLMTRMQKENKAFWNKTREQKAKSLNLTHEEICTLASIVDEETANDAEKPIIAGLYLNRLHKGMLLQADPTVKFAVGDFTLKRIKGEHLRKESPYNTYLNVGLPPGPIRIASIKGLDAVLNYQQHNYLYMCAKADFSGTHEYAATFNEHKKNARNYIKALNARNIH
ncbi:MAG: endolytic transglycosylase MltG [Bacteroidaceae bacterium]|nr:endolytic transglycosylase MltG [Bacteroidaceae bacterium]